MNPSLIARPISLRFFREKQQVIEIEDALFLEIQILNLARRAIVRVTEHPRFPYAHTLPRIIIVAIDT